MSSAALLQVMGPSCKIYALKRIRLAGRDAEAASGFIDEINLLLRLRNKPNIIQLIDSQVITRPAPVHHNTAQAHKPCSTQRLCLSRSAVSMLMVGRKNYGAGLHCWVLQHTISVVYIMWHT
jgi:hypothetical protein